MIEEFGKLHMWSIQGGFSKVHVMRLHFFIVRPTLARVCANKSEEHLCFYTKRRRAKNCSVLVLRLTLPEAVPPWATGAGPPSSFPGNWTPHLRVPLPELWTRSVSTSALSWFHLCSGQRGVSSGLRQAWEVIFLGLETLTEFSI